MDGELREGRRFVAGKVAKDGSQAIFGTLILDEKKPALVMDVTPPGGERIEETYALKSRPYLLYDFDFADLNSILQDKEPPKSFSFELPLIWPSETTMFRDQGQMRANFAAKEQHLGRDTLRYDLEVDEPTPATGHLWIDAKQRFIVEAELGLPNHLEYQDFRLKLERIDGGGKRSWDALTRTQYANCPTGN
jgi:hypothetical protein